MRLLWPICLIVKTSNLILSHATLSSADQTDHLNILINTDLVPVWKNTNMACVVNINNKQPNINNNQQCSFCDQRERERELDNEYEGIMRLYC